MLFNNRKKFSTNFPPLKYYNYLINNLKREFARFEQILINLIIDQYIKLLIKCLEKKIVV